MGSAVDAAIFSVAKWIDDREMFEAQVGAVARRLGPEVIEELPGRFHDPPYPAPPGFGPEERGLGGWLSTWQFAIFEMLFHFGATSLPVLRRVAYGRYDWTQGNAIEILVRLAAAGVEREQIISELRQEFPRLRYEATLYAVGPLLHHAANNPAIATVVRELQDIPAWREAAR